jgi:hypothetical protein
VPLPHPQAAASPALASHLPRARSTVVHGADYPLHPVTQTGQAEGGTFGSSRKRSRATAARTGQLPPPQSSRPTGTPSAAFHTPSHRNVQTRHVSWTSGRWWPADVTSCWAGPSLLPECPSQPGRFAARNPAQINGALAEEEAHSRRLRVDIAHGICPRRGGQWPAGSRPRNALLRLASAALPSSEGRAEARQCSQSSWIPTRPHGGGSASPPTPPDAVSLGIAHFLNASVGGEPKPAPGLPTA